MENSENKMKTRKYNRITDTKWKKNSTNVKIQTAKTTPTIVAEKRCR